MKSLDVDVDISIGWKALGWNTVSIMGCSCSEFGGLITMST